MAIIRNPLQCLSCGVKIVTRTAPGYAHSQEHKFLCPGCGVEIRFTFVHEKKEKLKYSFAEPINAKWVKSEEGAVETLSFDPDRLAPKDMTNVFSPFLAEAPRFSPRALQAYQREEGMRRGWRDSEWPWIQKLIVHFDNRNQTLFDKEANLDKNSSNAASWATRLHLLYKLFEGAFDNFTLNRVPEMQRVRQRIALAQAASPGLYGELVKLYMTSSRMVKLWHELNRIRSGFLSNYLSLSPVLRVQYWSSPPTHFSEFAVPEKNFDQLRQLYVDCFETLCRLTVITIGLEAIIHHKSLDIPTAKGKMTLWDYESMANGNKYTILRKYPIHDLLVPVIDHQLRNGIGHHSAVYAPMTDEVVYYKQDGETLRENRISYTEFVFKVLKMFSVVELAALYFHQSHVKACEAE